MKKIKILFTIPNFTTAGSGREMVNIIDRLDRSIFEPYVCVLQEGGAIFTELQDKGIPVIVKPFMVNGKTGMLAITTEAKRLATDFKRYHFDIWQSFNWSSDFSEALIAKFAGAKYVYVKKNMNWNRNAWKVKSFLSKQIVARNASMLFHYFSAPYLRRKTKLIYGGVDINRNGIADGVREQYYIPGDAYLVTCVAQLVRVKDQLTLVKAVANLEDVYVILAGDARDDEYVAELYSLIQELGLAERVLLAGQISDVRSLLKASDVFVLPTTNIGGHEEGCPVALMEAMAMRMPCIASNVAGNTDLLTTNKTGLLFKAGYVEELRACILKYKNDKEFSRQMAENARKLIEEEFTLEREAADFNALYKKMMRIR